MGKIALLLGNGLNNVTNAYKWETLIQDIAEYVKIEGINLAKEKPFPLLYEEIYLRNLRKGKVSEFELKSHIAEKVSQITPNEIHKSIKEINLSDILTTNYDYVIEQSLTNNTIEFCDQGLVMQQRYSLFRHTNINGSKIWHIHGELNKPGTILLGYEQYSGQLQQIRDYVALGTENAYKEHQFPPLIELLKTGCVENCSWIDLFFTADIHIVGLSLDYVETDLWWLITYRARGKLENKLPINNTITYYYPKELERKIQSKLELLSANEVKTESVGNKHSLNYYKKVFSRIKEKAS